MTLTFICLPSKSRYLSFSLLLAELMIGTKNQMMKSFAGKRFSLLSAELMIGTELILSLFRQLPLFQSPISGVNDWNLEDIEQIQAVRLFQSPISGVNDWNALEFSLCDNIVDTAPYLKLV